MPLELPDAEPLPLQVWEDGTVRVRESRVTLDVVVSAFDQGSTAEEIMLGYPTLRLADIYIILGYYRRHREEVESYLARRRQEGIEIRKKIEEICPPDGFRERLLARQA